MSDPDLNALENEWSHLSFRLSDEFVNKYADQPIDWGFPIGAGNSLGEITFYSKYSRLKADGTKERWHEACRRVVEGMFSIQKDHCAKARIPWNSNKARSSAEEAYDRMFRFLWTPPGRGIQFMGTPIILETSAPLYNCAMLSSKTLGPRNPTHFFTRLLEMSMLGIGVGFDTLGAGSLEIHEPTGSPEVFVIPDSREGWCESVDLLLRSHFLPSKRPVEFIYDELRPEGSPLKRFGGTSAGREPLIRLHNDIRTLFHGRAGTLITSEDIVDVQNLQGRCAVAGSSRRSAELALGLADDKAFIDLKNWEVNPVRMGPGGWGNLSNNSVIAEVGGHYDHLVDRIAMNGEPGLVFLDLGRSHGRLVDPPDNKDYRVVGVNPCQPAWAPLLTPAGICTLGDVEIGDQIWSEAGWTTIKNKWSTGVKAVYEYRTTSGAFYGTENHRVVSEGQKIEVGQADSIDTLVGPLSDMPINAQDVIDGLVVGDGSVHAASNDLVYLCVGSNDEDYFDSEVQKYLLEHRPGLKEYAWEVHTTIRAHELPKTYERCIPSRFLYGSPSIAAGFLRGLYSANGSVVRDRVTLKTASPMIRDNVQLMLSSLGIRSYYTTNRTRENEFSNGTYVMKESYDVNVTSDRSIFAQTIGFIQKYKTDKLNATLATVGKGKKTYEIRETNFIAYEEVFDITVDNEPHTYWSGGFNVSNCAEIFLDSEELCCLAETYPTRAESKEDFLRTQKFAFLYAKSVLLLSTHWPETNEVMTRNQRVGPSMSGVAQFVEHKENGWTILRDWSDTAYKELRRYDTVYSEWLGVRESIKHSSIKPSGSVSLLAGCWPGVHWPVASGDYLRRVRERATSPIVEMCRKAGYHIEPDVMDPDYTVVITFPASGPEGRSEREVPVWEKAHLAATMQRWWADNSVSVTLTFRPDEANQIGSVIKAFDGQLKTMSFMPMGDVPKYAQLPYEACEPEQFEAMRKKLKPFNWKKAYQNGSEPEGDQFCTNDSCELPR